MKHIKTITQLNESKEDDIAKVKDYMNKNYTEDWFNEQLDERAFDYVDEEELEEHDGDYAQAYQAYCMGGAIEYELLDEMTDEIEKELNISLSEDELGDLAKKHMIDNCEWYDRMVISEPGESKNDINDLMKGLDDIDNDGNGIEL